MERQPRMGTVVTMGVALAALVVVFYLTLFYGIEQRRNAERYCELLGGLYDGGSCLVVSVEVS